MSFWWNTQPVQKSEVKISLRQEKILPLLSVKLRKVFIIELYNRNFFAQNRALPSSSFHLPLSNRML